MAEYVRPEKVKRDEKTMSFEERLRKKQETGFDHFNAGAKLTERKEAMKVHAATKGKVKNKHEPRVRYSKLPVSTIKRELHIEKTGSGYERGVWKAKTDFARDPRFQSSSGHLNQGLFASSYSFIKEYQDDRFKTLKDSLKESQRQGDTDQIKQVKTLLADEREFSTR